MYVFIIVYDSFLTIYGIREAVYSGNIEVDKETHFY